MQYAAPLRRAGILLLALLAFAAGCDRDGDDDDGPMGLGGSTDVKAVYVSPASVPFVALGHTAQLKATAVNARGDTVPATFKWRSTNPNVASVDSATGLVTAVGAGSANIKAFAGDAEGQATVSVTQVSRTVVIDPKSLTLGAIGQTQQLSTTVKDANGNAIVGAPVTWSSSNSQVATVDQSGRVTAVCNGTTTVTATSGGMSGTSEVAVVTPTTVCTPPTARFTISTRTEPLIQASAEVVIENGAATRRIGITTGTDFIADIAVSPTGTDVRIHVAAAPSGHHTSLVNGQSVSEWTYRGVKPGENHRFEVVFRPSGPAPTPPCTPAYNVACFSAGNRMFVPSSLVPDVTSSITAIEASDTTKRFVMNFEVASGGFIGTVPETFAVVGSDACIFWRKPNGQPVTETSNRLASAPESDRCGSAPAGYSLRIRHTAANQWQVGGTTSSSGSATAVVSSATNPAQALPWACAMTVDGVSVTCPSITTGTDRSVQVTVASAGSRVITSVVTPPSGHHTSTVGGRSISADTVMLKPGETRRVEVIFRPNSAAAVATVTVSPSTATANVGGTQQFTATLKDGSGNTLTGRSVSWSSSNTAVATVNASGLATCAAAGTATITSASEGKSGTSQLTCQTSGGGATPDTSWVQRWSDANKTVMQVNGWRLQRSGIFPTRESDLPATLCMTGPSLGGCAIVADKAANGVYNLPMSRLVGKLPEGQIYYHFTDGGDRWLFFPNRNEPGICANVSGWTWVLGARWNNSGGVAKGEEFTCR